MTTLGLKKVSPEIVEAGHMSGVHALANVAPYLEHSISATEILVGVNQVIMLCNVAIFLTAFIGMPRVGREDARYDGEL